MREHGVARAVLAALIAVSLIAAAPGLVERARAEGASRHVELVMDLDQVQLLASSQGYCVDEVLAELAWAGLGAVTWNETNLDKLSRSGDLLVREGREIADLAAAGALPGPELAGLLSEGFFHAGFTYAWTADPEQGAWLRRAAVDNLRAGTYRIEERGDLTVLEVRLLKERALLLNLGFFRPEIERSGAAGLGLRVVPRPARAAGEPGAAGRKAAALLEAVDGLDLETSVVVFAGGEVPGYPDDLEATAELLAALDAPAGLIEHPGQLGNIEQSGLTRLVEETGYDVVRVYSVPDTKVFSPMELVWKVVHSVKERGLKLAFLRPYLVVPEHLVETVPAAPGGGSLYDPPAGRPLDYTPMLALNVNYLRQMVEWLGEEGFRVGAPTPLPGPAPLAPWRVALLALGPAAGLGLLWLELAGRSRRAGAVAVILTALTWCLTVLLTASGRTAAVQQTVAVLSALALPSLGAAWLARVWSRPETNGRRAVLVARDLLVPPALALAGGLLVAAAMGDVRFILELDYFRGVKLTYVAIPLAAAVFWIRNRYQVVDRPETWVKGAARLAATELRVWHAVAGALVGLVFIFYVGRSGHSLDFPVAGFEVDIKQWLEKALYARPRFKEIFIGYPALLVGAWLAHRASRGPEPATTRSAYLGWFALAASVGLVSIVNLFEHVRTPLVVSLLRVGHGLWVGILTALLALAAVRVILLVWPDVRDALAPEAGGAGEEREADAGASPAADGKEDVL